MSAAPLRALLALRPEAVTAAGRAYPPGDAAVRARLEHVLAVFADGYNTALRTRDTAALAEVLRARHDAQHVGFAFEGAGACLAALDLVTPWRARRLRAFVEGPGREHDYIAVVGAGLALARVPWGLRLWPWYARRLDPLVSWCLAEGYGFYQGVFRYARQIGTRRPAPAGLPLVARRLCDSGVGRSLWWSQTGSAPRIAAVIDTFAPARRADLWCGVGIAAAYAGGVDDEVLLELRRLSGVFAADLAAGVPFAARMRQKGRNPAPVTERACRLLAARGADEAATCLAENVAAVVADDSLPRETRLRDTYLFVRQRLTGVFQQSFQGERACSVPIPSSSFTTA